MANPQPTPFVRFSKELFEAFYQNPPDTVAACSLWLWVLRWTWADFGKEETAPRSFAQIAEETGLSRMGACRELKNLVRGRRLKIGPKGGYAIQKDYDIWRKTTPKRAVHFGSKPAQMALGLDLPEASPTVIQPYHRGIQKRITVGDNDVSPLDTSIRSKNTIENREVKSSQSSANKNDTARTRAEMGNPDLAPEGAPDFAKLTFKMKDELNDTWKASVEREKAKTACRRKCGRPRAAQTWPWCEPCTICSDCGEGRDGKRTFTVKDGAIICSGCAPAPVAK